ncbi:MAG: ATP-dependent DNA helicase, partial [Calditrichaeota bacterium]|nr:ATP-dependent DNA helicase [Calditrichota bacterium]
QILKIENGKVRVMDAEGQPPTLPFWLGEAPGRSHELSYSVSRLRETVSERLGELNDLPDNSSLDHSWKQAAIDWLTGELELNESAADQIATYLGVSKAALGEMPSQNTLVLERFFDEAGDMHLVIHSPFGNRLNRAWGLALRKRFCRNFNFELQAAANDNTIILSLGATHSFPLDEVFNYLHPNTVRQILIQAVLDSPIFEVRWRWNASRALAVLRRRAGKKVPAQIQRIQTEDLISLVFPDQLACFENIAGDREIPDHPLVNQTIHDCLYEAMDIELLERILADIHAGNKTLIAKDLREASPLAHEILNARPYAFLDDAPLEERRTRAVMNRRWLDPKEASELGQLDQAAIDAVRAEVWPDVQTGDELLDALVLFGFLTEDEGKRGNSLTDWSSLFAELLESKRATKLITDKQQFWIAVERLPEMQAVFPNAKMSPEMPIPDRIEERAKSIDQPLKELIRNRLEASGPIQSGQIADLMGLSDHQVESQLVALENEGFVFRGHFTPGQDELEWCERRLLARIHRYTLKRLRSEVQPVSAQDFMRFLFDWQYLTQRGEGPEFLKTVLEQLEGYEAAAASWESELLPARMKFYDHQILDSVCLSGTVVWGRFRRDLNNGSKKASPIKTTPISFVQRSNLNHWKELTAFEQTIELSSYAEQVYQTLAQNGASFFDEIVDRSRLLRTQVEEAMNELVANGLISADSFTGLRSLLIPANKKVRSNYRMRKRSQIFDSSQAGRWWILKRNEAVAEENQFSIEQIELFARQLLRRYGVVFRKLVYQEKAAPPWRDLVRVLRRMEARGEIRGGRFVDAVWGEQFALEEAVTQLRKTRKAEKDGQLVTISAADPLNLVGIITPEQRIPAFYKNRILYKDGETIAVRNKNDVVFLKAIPDAEKWNYQKTLIYRNANPRLNVYLGKEKIPVPGSN